MAYTLKRVDTSNNLSLLFGDFIIGSNVYNIRTTNAGTYKFTLAGGGGGGGETLPSGYWDRSLGGKGGCGALIMATFQNLPANLNIKIIIGGRGYQGRFMGNGGGGLTQVYTPDDNGATINIIAGGGGGSAYGDIGGDAGFETNTWTGDSSQVGTHASLQAGGSGMQGGDGGSLGSNGYDGMGGTGGGGGSANGGVGNTNGITSAGGKGIGGSIGGINGGGNGGSSGGGGGAGWAGGAGGTGGKGGGAGSSLVNGTASYTISKNSSQVDGYVLIIGAVASQATQAAVSGAYNPNAPAPAPISPPVVQGAGGAQKVQGASVVQKVQEAQEAQEAQEPQEAGVQRVQEGGSVTLPAPVPVSVPTTAMKSESSDTSMYIIIIIIIIVLLIAGGGGVWYYKNKMKK